MDLKLTAQQVEDLIHRGFGREFLKVEEVRPGYARIRLPFRPSMLRPGEVLSGPSLFSAADTGMYALVLSHEGPALMAVTSDLNMHFLNKAKKGDVIAETTLLKRGRRFIVMQVSLSSSAEPGKTVAHVTGSYALPAA